MSSFLPDTENFFKYILTVGVLMILFGLVYPLKQEQLLRTKVIEIHEHESLLKIEVAFLEMQVNNLDSLQRKTQQKVNQLKESKSKLPLSDQISYDEKIISLVNSFYEKRNIGLNAARDAKLKRAKLEYEQKRYDEIKMQIHEYFIFKTFFWGLGSILLIGGLFFWMDSTYFDERLKAHQSQLQPPYTSKYVQCILYVQGMVTRFRWLAIAILLIIAILFARAIVK